MSNTIQTPIEKVILKFEERISLKFVPDDRFYKKVGINQKRFGMIVKGKLEMYAYEAKSLSDFFGVSVNEFF